ncbi:MAG: DUF3427 domain-containing protein [Candidatus Methanomethylophilaceae archaeon]|nr:DUF3427 domain-containing protein [Candidatus Methanomethylophilaceae archaeon]
MDLVPGIYESVISDAMEISLKSMGDAVDIDRGPIPYEASSDVLSRYVQKVLKRGLTAIRDKALLASDKGSREPAALKAEIDACNRILGLISELSEEDDILDWRIGEAGERLLSIWNRMDAKVRRPNTSISVSTLFTGGRRGVPIYEELCREIETSEEADLLVSFIKNSGLRLIMDSLTRMTDRGGRVRVLTTTYTGATDPQAIERLSRLRNTEVRISYDSKSTRLHAKSYLFKRANGFDTAFIGSSNLSNAAISDGMEWNVKLTEQDAPQVISVMRSAFDTYWSSPDFEPYEPLEDLPKLNAALRRESDRGTRVGGVRFDIRPYLFQQEILDELEAEREVFGSYRNLVVAATGTGKTVVSAFDYRRFREGAERDRLLYVAHRRDILVKSLATYRAILRDDNFGGLCDGHGASGDMGHVFMTIESFESRKVYESVDPGYYDYIVVDETHHAAAKSYRRLLSMEPRIMLGLTATPERMDGEDILKYFNGRIASQIRLPEAINRELLVPFQYFAVTDPASLSGVRFERGRFSEEDLEALYTSAEGDARVRAILDALDRYQPDIGSVKGLGFCVNIVHAEYMARKFNEAGIPSMALSSMSGSDSRDSAPGMLARGEVRFVFSVNIYNEGVDIPEVNTVLFLRPTDSMTVFVQQLGRGLRRCEGKSELTVLDFVGQFDKRYTMYERKLRYLTSLNTVSVLAQIDKGFCGLPNGCSIKLEEVAKERILASIKGSAPSGKRRLLERIRDGMRSNGSPPGLEGFLEENGIGLNDIYRNRVTYTGLCAEAGGGSAEEKDEKLFSKGFARLSTADSCDWIAWMEGAISGAAGVADRLGRRFAAMLYYTFYDRSGPDEGFSSIEDFIGMLRSKTGYMDEMRAVLSICRNGIRHAGQKAPSEPSCALRLHCRYHRNQILAAIGKTTFEYRYPFREGVLNIDDSTDVLLVNLNKSEDEFTPTTMYEDYAMDERLFHWQSQSTTSIDSRTGRRYTSGDPRHRALLFVRENKTEKGQPMPFMYLGKGRHRSHSGSRPIDIVWEMEERMPPEILAYSPVNG